MTFPTDRIQAYMALLMGGAMAIIMLGFMLSMYRNSTVNVGTRPWPSPDRWRSFEAEPRWGTVPGCAP